MFLKARGRGQRHRVEVADQREDETFDPNSES